MGVEYKHYLIPSDPVFIPDNNLISKIDAVLENWKLKSDNPEIYNLTDGNITKTYGEISRLSFGNGIGLKYPEVQGEQIPEIFGQSYYGDKVQNEERYVQQIVLIAGTDFRIHPSNEQVYISIVSPPSENSAIDPYSEYDEVFRGAYAESFSCTRQTKAPITNVSFYNYNIKDVSKFKGYWRTALIIDFGKDLPKIVDKEFYIPNKEFLNEIEDAFGMTLLEIGDIY